MAAVSASPSIFLKSRLSVVPLMSDLSSRNISSLAFCCGVRPAYLGEMAARYLSIAVVW